MTLQQLRYLIAVAIYGSINAAAKNLYISQPSLSEAINGLEQEFGFEIFERTSKGIRITSKGLKLLNDAREVVKEADCLEKKYFGFTGAKEIFRVSAQHYTFCTEAFYRLVKNSNLEKYDFSLIETSGQHVLENVRDNKSELGLLYWNETNRASIEKKLAAGRLEFHVLFHSPQCVMLTKGHVLAAKKILNVDDLSDYVYIAFKTGEFNSRYFTEETRTVFDHGKTVNCTDRSTMFYLLRKLQGFTICTNMVHKELNGPDIVTVPLAKTSTVAVGYIIRADEELSATGKKFVELLETCAPKMHEL